MTTKVWDFLKSTDLESKTEERRISVLLHVAGEWQKIDTFVLMNKKKLDYVSTTFGDYCKPKVNESVKRLFFSRVQNSDENFKSFLTDLKKLVHHDRKENVWDSYSKGWGFKAQTKNNFFYLIEYISTWGWI